MGTTEHTRRERRNQTADDASQQQGNGNQASPQIPNEILGLIEEFGSPAYLNKDGRVNKLNEPFWSALYAKENIILFDPNRGEFFDYDEKARIFRSESDASIRKKLAMRIFETGKEWVGYMGLTVFRSEHAIRGIIAHLRGACEERDPFNRNRNLINLANCSIRVTLQGFTREDTSPSHRALARSAIHYDETAGCDKFRTALLSPLCDEDQRLLQKMFALALTGFNPLHKILVMDGVAGSGKSTYAQIISIVIGLDKVTTLRTKHLSNRFEIGQLNGKTLLIGPDVDSDFFQVEGASQLKSLTGGDILKGENKISNHTFDVPGDFNAIINANTRLKIRLQGDAGAWARRLAIVRYSKRYSGKTVLDFHKVLANTEGAGILNWGLDGLALLRADLESHGDIVLSDAQAERVESLVQESDGLKIFLLQCVEAAHGGSVTVDQLVKRFTLFCQQRNWSVDPVKKIQGALETLILEMFSVGKSNDIAIQGHDGQTCTVCGFRNLRFK
jgi:P4 family phage/plasmid primase-like protien